MPRTHPKEFRDDVVAVARKSDASIGEVAKDVDIDVEASSDASSLVMSQIGGDVSHPTSDCSAVATQ